MPSHNKAPKVVKNPTSANRSFNKPVYASKTPSNPTKKSTADTKVSPRAGGGKY